MYEYFLRPSSDVVSSNSRGKKSRKKNAEGGGNVLEVNFLGRLGYGFEGEGSKFVGQCWLGSLEGAVSKWSKVIYMRRGERGGWGLMPAHVG